MQVLKLRKYETIVDDDVAIWIKTAKINIGAANKRLPSIRCTKLGVELSRVIVGLKKGDPRTVDHINHNRLDNRRANLRICSMRENLRNRRGKKSSKTHYKGVHPQQGRYRAQICYQGKQYSLGMFATAEEAAKVYDGKARELFGEYAFLNFQTLRT